MFGMHLIDHVFILNFVFKCEICVLIVFVLWLVLMFIAAHIRISL